MRITAGQLVRLILEIRDEYANKDVDLQKPGVIRDLILQHYPQVSYVERPPTPSQMERLYLSRLLRAFDVPALDPDPGPMQTTTAAPDLPPHSQAERMLSEVSFLRCEPMAALTYTVMRALHHNHEESLNWGRRSIGVWSLLSRQDRSPEHQKFSTPEKPRGRNIPEEYTADFIEKGLHSL